MFESINQLSEHISELHGKYGYVKVNIPLEDGSNESVWAVPANERAKVKFGDDESTDEVTEAYVVNHCLCGITWGSLVEVVVTQGDLRLVVKKVLKTTEEMIKCKD